MNGLRIALGIRAQLLLVLTVFLAIPFLGWGYVRELERVLRDAQEQKLAGTAQAVATALHDRPRLFDLTPLPLETLDAERGAGGSAAPTPQAPHPGAVAEVAQILQGMSRTTARIWIVDRRLDVLARTGSLHAAPPAPGPEPEGLAKVGRWIERTVLHPLYALVLAQPTEEFSEEGAGATLANMREVDGALAGILATARRPTPDGRAMVVAAAHPIWVGDQIRGAVVVEETANSALVQRNRAFERLFTIVLAALLVGSVALTLFASRLTARIRKLRDDAEAAIDAQGRVRGALAGSRAGDEIGDLSRSFSSVLSRLAQYAGYRENMASRLSHELRTPLAVVRSSLDNLRLQPLSDEARVYIDRAQGGLQRLADILTRMTEATRLEQSLHDAERERFDFVGARHGLRRRLSARVSGSRLPARRARGAAADRRSARPHRTDAGQARRQRARVRAARHADRDPARGQRATVYGSRWRTRGRDCPRACASACSIRWCRSARSPAAKSRISASGSTSCGSSRNSTTAPCARTIAPTAGASSSPCCCRPAPSVEWSSRRAASTIGL